MSMRFFLWFGRSAAVAALWTVSALGSNDNFADAWAISAIPYTTNGIITTGSKEPGEPNHAGGTGGGKSVWWVLTPDTTGPVRVDTIGSGFSSVVGVYTGSAVDALTEVSSGYGNHKVNFNAVSGTSYHIALDSSTTFFTNYVLNVSIGVPPPANDAFASAAVLTGSSASIAASNAAATKEVGEPALAGNAGGKSVWWSWTAPSSGWMHLSTTNSTFNTLLGVYTGSSVGALSLVASDDNSGYDISTSRLSFYATTGVTYSIVVDGWRAQEGTVVLNLMPGSAPPANDAFAASTVISGTSYSVASASNVGATHEVGEPLHLFYPCYGSVWWQWTAPATTNVQVDTIGSSFDTLLAVYTGSAVTALTTVAGDDNEGGGGTSLTTFGAVAGTTYRIVVDGAFGAAGTACLNLSPAAPVLPPANDGFANAMVIVGASYTNNSASTVNATKEIGEPAHAAFGGGKTVWWSWTAPAANTVEIDTIGSSFDTQLTVYTGTAVDALSLPAVASDDQSGGNNTSKLSFTPVAGTTYRIVVDGWGGQSGTVKLHLRTLLAPPTGPLNDNFASATAISDSAYTNNTASNVNATKEPGEPYHAGFAGAKSVWWQWTAPTTGNVQVDTIGSNFDTLLAVYTGTAVGTLTNIASNDQYGGLDTSLLTFAAVAGTTYRIAVDGWNGQSGTAWLHLGYEAASTAPANDDFVDATVIGGSSYTNANASTLGASKESGEPFHAGFAGGKSVWWSWTALSDGVVRIDTIGSSFYTLLAVYTGSSVDALTHIASDAESGGGGTSLLAFTAVAGTTYRITVDGYDAQSGTAVLRLLLTLPSAAPVNDNFADATLISGSVYTNSSATNAHATKETGEPNHAGYGGGKSVWWSWTAPSNGIAQVDTIGSGFDTLLAVYTGTAVDALTWVASDDQSGGLNTSLLTFAAAEGTTYRIAVDGWLADSGALMLHLGCTAAPAAPVNDDFANATAASGPGYTSAVILTTAATKETGEPDHHGYAGGKSVWWTWTASATVRVQAGAQGATYPSVLGVYTGTAVDALSTVSSGFGGHSVYFDAVEGTTYYFALDVQGGGGGSIGLSLGYAPAAPANDLFANAAVLSGGQCEVLGATSVGATKETGEPNHWGDVGGKSVWWRWTAPASGLAQLDLSGSTFSVFAGVYTGEAVGLLTEVASGSGVVTPVLFEAVSGVTYSIAVDGYHGQSGSVTLHLSLPVQVAVVNVGMVGVGSEQRFAFDVTGPEGGTVVIRWTPQLNPVDWTELQTSVLGAAPLTVVDPAPPTAARFYQAIILP